MIKINLHVDGEKTFLELPAGTTVGQINEYARQLTPGAGFRVNGQPAQAGQTLNNGDRVQNVPTGGQLA